MLHREPLPALGCCEPVPGQLSVLRHGSPPGAFPQAVCLVQGWFRALPVSLTLFSVPAQAPLSRLLVPVLLALGWILGCALMVYIVFS